MLFRLPRELRNLIYEYAIGGNNICWAPDPPDPSLGHGYPFGVVPPGKFEVWIPDKWTTTLYGSLPITTLLQLQTTSRQLHAEIGNLIFTANTFDFTGWHGEQLLNALPFAGLRAVRYARLLTMVGHPNQRHLPRLAGLFGLQKLEVAVYVLGLYETTQFNSGIEQVIRQATGITVPIVGSYYEYRRANDPLRATSRVGIREDPKP